MNHTTTRRTWLKAAVAAACAPAYIPARVLGTDNEFRDACEQVSPGENWQEVGTALERAGGSLVALPSVSDALPEVQDWSTSLFPLRRQSCSVRTDGAGLVTETLYRSWLSLD